jgi:hypothetical protein
MRDARDGLDEWDDLDDREDREDEGLALQVRILAMDDGDGVMGGSIVSSFGMVIVSRSDEGDVDEKVAAGLTVAGAGEAMRSDTIWEANFVATSSLGPRIASAKVFCLRARCMMEAWLGLPCQLSAAISCRRSALRNILIARRE